jgi:hypothetical protein
MEGAWQPPPPGMVARAEQEYSAARDDVDRLVADVRDVLAHGVPEIEAVADLWHALRIKQHDPAVALLGAAAIMRLAKTPLSE